MPSDPLLNTRIGNVKLTRRLGAGAMGVVYQGWHEAFAQEVAVKFLTAASGNSRERFIREGRAAARIENEHVIRVLDAGEAAGKAYLVLEFVNGRSLGEILDAQETADRQAPPAGRPAGSLPDPGVVAHLGAQMARGLAAIHAKGIVHRDIKPDNVLVSREGRAKIADLGLAKHLDDAEAVRLTGTGMVVGTPLYVSPEGIRDPKTISGASDIYSLGASLFHMLAGRTLYSGSCSKVMRDHIEANPPDLRKLSPNLPQGLVRIIERMIAKLPMDRHQSPAEIAKELEVLKLELAGGEGSLPTSRSGILNIIAAEKDRIDQLERQVASTGTRILIWQTAAARSRTPAVCARGGPRKVAPPCK